MQFILARCCVPQLHLIQFIIDIFDRRDLFFELTCVYFEYNKRCTMDDGHKFAFYNRKSDYNRRNKFDGCPYNCIACTNVLLFWSRASDTHFALIKFHIYFSLYFLTQYSLFTSNPG